MITLCSEGKASYDWQPSMTVDYCSLRCGQWSRSCRLQRQLVRRCLVFMRHFTRGSNWLFLLNHVIVHVNLQPLSIVYFNTFNTFLWSVSPHVHYHRVCTLQMHQVQTSNFLIGGNFLYFLSADLRSNFFEWPLQFLALTELISNCRNKEHAGTNLLSQYGWGVLQMNPLEIAIGKRVLESSWVLEFQALRPQDQSLIWGYGW